MLWRVEIKEKNGILDVLGAGIEKDILDLGIKGISSVKAIQVFNISGAISEAEIQTISRDLLTDRITQEYRYCPADTFRPPVSTANLHVVEIAHNPGVMDPVEESTLKAIKDLGILKVDAIRTARQYHLSGAITDKTLARIVDKALANKLIQHVVTFAPPVAAVKKASVPTKAAVKVIDLLDSTDKGLLELSKTGQLFLNLTEMKTIQKHFQTLGRNPTDCELETIAQTWSEHCNHKTFRGNIACDFKESGKRKKFLIQNLLKSTIIKATTKLNVDWCVSVFHDNAGIIAFDQEDNVCFKVETHNHPSALEPFGGANTGIGGVIRDILGTGLGAKPIANTDVFCFAPPEHSQKLPAGTLHPKRVMKGVVSGVRDYGNKMGIPTVNGAICFDEKFVGNPLVYCGTVGIIPKGKEHKAARKGDLVVVAGGRTGRDGIHGATFSSGELTSESEVVSSGAVQIGNPIQEKKILDVLLQARDQNLYSAITDCGAGGLSSAVGEMAQVLGARVDLDKVPLKYQGLSYMEIWISESQERMVFSVPPENVDKMIAVFRAENVEATVIGEFTGTGLLELFYQGQAVCMLAMSFLHDGVPKITKSAVWAKPKLKTPRFSCPTDLTKDLLKALGDYNVCSKEWVIRQYDHEVKGGTVIKPLSGVTADGPSDAAVILPKLNSFQGLAISNGINPRFGQIDPYWMAASVIDEAIRQVVAVGGDPDRIAILDNFCWGNPDKPDRLGGLVRAAQACYDFAVGYGTPFISGKDSLYNEYAEGNKSIAIPGTLLISALGIVADVRKCVTMDFKQAGNAIYLVGETKPELGGSVYFALKGGVGENVPQVDANKGRKIFRSLFAAAQKALVRAMHDCSEGGLGVALAEMAFSGGLGVTARLDQVRYQGSPRRDDFILFSESNSRFLVEVAPQDQKAFEKLLSGVSFDVIGRVEATPEFVVYGSKKNVCVAAFNNDLKDAWQKPLRW